MTKIKNVKIVKEKIIPLLLASTLTLTTSCSSKSVNMGKISTRELMSIEEIKKNTLLDELENTEYGMFSENLTVLSAAIKLEEYMTIIKKIEKIKFDEIENLERITEEEKQEAERLTQEEIEEQIKYYKNGSPDVVASERRVKAYKMLNYLQDYIPTFIHQKGKEISTKFMIAAVKSAVASALNIPTEDYHEISIPARYDSLKEEIKVYHVKVGKEEYDISKSSKELWETIDYIYQVQNATFPNQKQELETYKKALNYAKITISAGATKRSHIITSKNDYAYIKKNYT